MLATVITVKVNGVVHNIQISIESRSVAVAQILELINEARFEITEKEE